MPRGSSRACAEPWLTTFAKNDADIFALHPGPGPDWTPPAPPTRTPEQRLAETEAELLVLAIERFADSPGRAGDLARSIIVQRAVLGREGRSDL